MEGRKRNTERNDRPEEREGSRQESGLCGQESGPGHEGRAASMVLGLHRKSGSRDAPVGCTWQTIRPLLDDEADNLASEMKTAFESANNSFHHYGGTRRGDREPSAMETDD